MIVIKRYANRKLYNTNSKKYIALAGVAELVRSGEEIQVVDHATGDDLTATILAQIMFEREKKGAGPLPLNMLSRILQVGEKQVSSIRRALNPPEEMARMVDKEIERRIERLVEKESIADEEGARLLELLLRESAPLDNSTVEQQVEEALRARGVPSRADLNQLSTQLEALTHALDNLAGDDKT